MREQLISEILKYTPVNAQEAADKQVILSALNNDSDLFFRTNLTQHMTASAWVVNKGFDRVLMVYHKIYNSWSWLGGHADGDEDLLAVAIREVQEESGIQNVAPVSRDIYSLEVLTVDGHEKRGSYVPSHLHLNVTYLLMADDTEELRIKEDENSGVRWFTMDEALQKSTEPWFVERIYKKLNEKLRHYK
ncbi:MAG: NUDIX hydrolase [Clostridia bacterium]|nr:NUDIX hydrolase [Clostridia bacterium]